jgi:peptidoglycan/xylan/chitin deacetylase (PgdA/CDA1 family)
MEHFDPDTYMAAFPFYTRNDRIFRYLRDSVLGEARYDAVMQEMMRDSNFDAAGLSERLWMNDAHLKTLRDAGHIVGLHSYSHPTCLSDKNAAAQASEYQRNFDHLTRVLGEAPTSMSHPCNSYNADTIAILLRLGIRIGFRANMERIADCFPFEFPREDHANLMKAMRS